MEGAAPDHALAILLRIKEESGPSSSLAVEWEGEDVGRWKRVKQDPDTGEINEL